MARSAKEDSLEKFRFKVTIISVATSITGIVDTLSNFTDPLLGPKNTSLKVFSRAGFSEVTLPKSNIAEIKYRENLDALRHIKVAGLVNYDPVTLRRGVTANRDLYDWYRLVNEEIALQGVANELNGDAKYSVSQSDDYRKDVIIEVLDREGKAIKGWYLFNAWPNSYQPGDSLNASAEEKLVEELTLTYEYFLELEGGLEGFAKEMAKGALLENASKINQILKRG